MRVATRRVLQRCWLGVLVAAALGAAAQPRAQPAPGEDTLVLAADATLADAVRSGDKSVARRLLSLQFSAVDETGKVHERKEFLNGLKEVAASAANDAEVKIYGRVAMVTGHRKSALGSEVFFLDIWAKQKGSWRALVAQDVVLAAPGAPADAELDPQLLRDAAKFVDCKNPCETIPYRVRSPAEQDIINTFQAIEKATFTRNPAEYAKHVADEFMHYRSGSPPISKSERVAFIEDQKTQNIPAILPAIQTMRLWVYGDGAAMVSADGGPDDTVPLSRTARVWVRRNGQWQMAISVQTDIK